MRRSAAFTFSWVASSAYTVRVRWWRSVSMKQLRCSTLWLAWHPALDPSAGSHLTLLLTIITVRLPACLPACRWH